MGEKTIMTEEHVRAILQEMANIIGEKQGVQITVNIKRRWKERYKWIRKKEN